MKLRKSKKKYKIVIDPKKIGLQIKQQQINVTGDIAKKQIGLEYKLEF